MKLGALIIIVCALISLAVTCSTARTDAAMMIDSGDSFQRQIITEVALLDCNKLINITDEQGRFKVNEFGGPIFRWPGTYCGVQSTDYNEYDDLIEARVQLSIGCEGELPSEDGKIYGLQEKEYKYIVRFDDGAVIRREPIEISPHLIRAGTWVREFQDPQCPVKEEELKLWQRNQT